MRDIFIYYKIQNIIGDVDVNDEGSITAAP